MLGKNLSGRAEIKSGAEAHALRDFTDDPPVGPRFARNVEKSALSGNSTFGVCDCAVLLAPAGSRQQHTCVRGCIGLLYAVRYYNQLTARQCRAHAVCIRHADHGVGAHDPHCLDPSSVHGLEQVDSFQARLPGNAWAAPEILSQGLVSGVVEIQVRGESGGHSSCFPASHGVGLACEREGAHAGTADPTCQEVAIDDAVDFVSSRRGLIDPLREGGDYALVGCEEPIELTESARVETADFGHFFGRRLSDLHRYVGSVV